MATTGDELPDSLRRFFWETDASALTWGRDREYITARLLDVGDWEAIRWVRERQGDEGLRRFIRRRRGRGLSPRQLRYWEIALDLPHDEVTAWIEAVSSSTWVHRSDR